MIIYIITLILLFILTMIINDIIIVKKVVGEFNSKNFPKLVLYKPKGNNNAN